MRNFEIVKTEVGYLMYVDGTYHEVPEEALTQTYEEREREYENERVDLKEPEEA